MKQEPGRQQPGISGLQAGEDVNVADLWEMKERAFNLAWIIRRLINSAKAHKDMTLICGSAIEYMKNHGLDYDDDADSNNQAAG